MWRAFWSPTRRSCALPTSHDHALGAAHTRGVEEVVIIGRRGPLQATFTTLELREPGDLKGLEGVDVMVKPADFADITDEDAEAAGKIVKNNIKVLRGYVGREPTPGQPAESCFQVPSIQPIEIRGDGGSKKWCSAATNWSPTTAGASRRQPAPGRCCRRSWWFARSARECRPALFRSMSRPARSFPHTDGRIDGSRNEYVVGWMDEPRASSAVTKEAIHSTPSTRWSDRIWLGDGMEDYAATLLESMLSRQPQLVTDAHWELITIRHERSTGEPHGRPRVKLSSVADLLRIGHG